VHDALTEAIVDGRLEQNVMYSVQALADQFNVSRTPVREAILQLARRGLVQTVRNQGVLVVERSLGDLRQIFELRRWIEPPAVREVVERADEHDLARIHGHLEDMRRSAARRDAKTLAKHDRRLHNAIIVASGNLRAARMLDEMRDFVITHGRTTAGRTRTFEDTMAEHERIVAAIDARDADAAAAYMVEHLDASLAAIIEQERQQTPAVGPSPRTP
jgi:DNA-binding GntR family transcriptional regulator